MRAFPAAAIILLTGAAGCSLLSSPEKEYVSQDEVLEAAARAARYTPDPSRYVLLNADVGPDSITFQYRGVQHAGDRAWAIRFSQKSTEQRPAELVDIDRLLGALGQGKDEFDVLEKAQRKEGGLTVDFARYRYRSPLGDPHGRPLAAYGAAAVVKVPRSPAPLIYQMNVEDIEGDRPDLGWREIEPLVRAVPR